MENPILKFCIQVAFNKTVCIVSFAWAAFLETVPRPKMHQFIEEEELTAQRDAAVSLFKGLQEKVGWCQCVNMLMVHKCTQSAARLRIIRNSYS